MHTSPASHIYDWGGYALSNFSWISMFLMLISSISEFYLSSQIRDVKVKMSKYHLLAHYYCRLSTAIISLNYNHQSNIFFLFNDKRNMLYLQFQMKVNRISSVCRKWITTFHLLVYLYSFVFTFLTSMQNISLRFVIDEAYFMLFEPSFHYVI